MSDDRLWDLFAGAVVHLDLPTGPALLEPKSAGEVGAFPFDRPVHIVTAYNPDGLQAHENANLRRHRELSIAIADLATIPSVGSAPDGSVREPGFGLLDVSLADALDLGRTFGQVAIYQWSPDALTIVGVDGVLQRRLGWSLSNAH